MGRATMLEAPFLCDFLGSNVVARAWFQRVDEFQYQHPKRSPSSVERDFEKNR
jgi:hypothetical protein